MEVFSSNSTGVPDIEAVLSKCGVPSDLLKRNVPIQKIWRYYLPGIKARCVVVEKDYIDKDYIEDYASYYARCFRDYPKRCVRIHFFSRVYTAKEISDVLSGECSQIGEDEFKDSYLGFVVVRPLPKTIVGRTCLAHYPQDESGRHYPALCKIAVSFFGFPLEVECMPFQEQDCAVSACATCALWSSLKVLAPVFGNRVGSPSTITALAMGSGHSLERIFPNAGLTPDEMLYAMRQMGLDPLYVQFTEQDKVGWADRFLGCLYAYLNARIPVIAVVEIKKQGGQSLGFHAISINGYHVDPKTKRMTGELVAAAIDKIYANDDQIVPYSRVEIHRQNSNKMEIVSAWNDEDATEAESKCLFAPAGLLIPLYHKIRVCYDEIWNVAFQFQRIVHNTVAVAQNYVWDISLKTCQDVKSDIRKDAAFTPTEKLQLLEQSMPHFIWRIDIEGVDVHEGKTATAWIDATDAGQTLYVVDVWAFKKEICDASVALCKIDSSLEGENVLIKAFKEFADRRKDKWDNDGWHKWTRKLLKELPSRN